MICPNCGYHNAPGDEFCGSCGNFLAWNSTAGDAQTNSSGAAQPPPSPDSPTAAYPATPIPAPMTPPPPPPPQRAAGTPPPPAVPYAAPAWSANLQRCDVCGTANELSRTFCLNCGAKLKTAGTMGGVAAVAAARNTGTNWRPLLYLIGGLAIFLGFAAIAYAAFGGFSRGGAATPGPLASLIAAASSSPSPAPSIAAPTASASATAPPASTPSGSVTAPSPSTAASSAPPVSPPAGTGTPATASPSGSFVCTASTFSATQPGGWKIFHAHWTRQGPADTLYLEMQPASSSSTAGVDANILAPDQVQTTYGVPGPSTGDVAVVLAFNDAVSLTGPFGSSVGYKSLQEFQIYRTGGRVLVVMGVNGQGCYGLSSDAWTSGSSSTPELAVALQH